MENEEHDLDDSEMEAEVKKFLSMDFYCMFISYFSNKYIYTSNL